MRVTYRIPTNDPYAYVEIETENIAEDKESLNVIADNYEAFTKKMKGEPEGFGLTDKEFNAVLDELLTKGSITGDPGMLETMTKEQSGIVQAIKRSIKRTT